MWPLWHLIRVMRRQEKIHLTKKKYILRFFYHFDIFDIFWQILTNSDIFWHILRIFWQLLTFFYNFTISYNFDNILNFWFFLQFLTIFYNFDNLFFTIFENIDWFFYNTLQVGQLLTIFDNFEKFYNAFTHFWSNFDEIFCAGVKP